MTDGLALRSWVRKLVKKALTKQTKYSTDETVVGTWIDGKPIYRKVITNLSIKVNSDATWTQIYNVSSLKIETLVNVSCFNGNSLHIYMDYLGLQDNYVCYAGGASGSATAKTLILEYTKTTDTATT